MGIPERHHKSRRQLSFSRRQFLLGGGAAMLASAGAYGYASGVEPLWVDYSEVSMDLRGAHDDLSGLRLIQLSDLHCSRQVPYEFLAEHCARCSEADADVIVITGDFCTEARRRELPSVRKLMETLRARLGVYAVLGNHDYAVFSAGRRRRRMRSRSRADELVRVLEDGGVRVLRNEGVTLARGAGRLRLVGVDDVWAGRDDVAGSFSANEGDLPCIAMIHNPDAIFQFGNTPAQWVLSGHTHGGQVCVPFFGPPILPVRHRQFSAGLYEVGDVNLYVNRGLGYVRRIRFNCRPEITTFTLRVG